MQQIRAECASPHTALDPEDYELSRDESCNLIVSSADQNIKRVVYFDIDGNRHVVDRDQNGNRFGTEVNLSETALAGVAQTGGTLFVKAGKRRGRRHGRTGAIELDIPACEPASNCSVAADPLFDKVSKAIKANNPDFRSLISEDVPNLCIAGSNVTGEVIYLFDWRGLSADPNLNYITGEFPDPSTGDPIEIGLTFFPDDEVVDCAIELGCTF